MLRLLDFIVRTPHSMDRYQENAESAAPLRRIAVVELRCARRARTRRPTRRDSRTPGICASVSRGRIASGMSRALGEGIYRGGARSERGCGSRKLAGSIPSAVTRQDEVIVASTDTVAGACTSRLWPSATSSSLTSSSSSSDTPRDIELSIRGVADAAATPERWLDPTQFAAAPAQRSEPACAAYSTSARPADTRHSRSSSAPMRHGAGDVVVKMRSWKRAGWIGAKRG
jgi:hypothetical protein